jgi:DNA repair exonuclease SbcCD ATPase subunit
MTLDVEPAGPHDRAMRRRSGDEEVEEVRVTNLEKELDRLYTLHPASFVAERERLARALRKAGQRDEAEQVKRMRKPTVSAWTINQLARQERRDVDPLLDAGHRLREAQQGLLAGEDRKSLDEARRTQRDALASLRQAARRILVDAGHGSETTLDRIMGTLRAAAVSSEGRELLARGRLTGDLEATGFELLAPLAEGVSQELEPGKQRPSERKRTAPRKPVSRPRERDAAQERQRQEDRKRVETAGRDFREARATMKAAKKGLAEAERNASRARRELAQAEERVRKSEAAAAEAQMAVEQAEKQLRDAERKAP